MFKRCLALTLGLALILAAGWAVGQNSPPPKKQAGPKPAAEAKAAQPGAETKPVKPGAEVKAAQPAAEAKPGAEAKAGQPEPRQEDQPINITSERLEADDVAMTATFIGTVKAVQGPTTLWCDRMIVHYVRLEPEKDQPKEEAQREIKQIEAIGHVKLVKANMTALGQHGVYEMDDRRVVLWGNPKLIQDENTVTGDKVIVHLDTNRAEVEGGPDQVEAVLVPRKKKPAEAKSGGG